MSEKSEQQKAMELLTRGREAIAAREQAVRNLQWSGKLSKAEKAVLYHACKAYDLDPAMREIVVLGGNMYVTVAAMTRVANRSGTYAGCRYSRLEAEQEGEVRYLCTVTKIVGRDGRGDPVMGTFEGIGSARPGEKNPVAKTYPHEMAMTRARGRALHAAYEVSIPILEEQDIPRGAQVIEVTPELLEEGRQVEEGQRQDEPEQDPPREAGEEG